MNTMDERQTMNAGKAAIAALFLVVMVCLGIAAWDYFSNGRIDHGWPIIVMVLGAGLFWMLESLLGAEAPRGVLGEELPTGSSSSARRVRFASYALSAAGLAAGLTLVGALGYFLADDKQAFDLLPISGAGGPVGLFVVSFVAEIVIFFALNVLLGEMAARRHERTLARLEGSIN